MRLIDLVKLDSPRLFDADWLNRLALRRGPDCFCLLVSSDAAATVHTPRRQAELGGGASLVLSPEEPFTLRVEQTGNSAFIGAIFFEVGPQDPIYAVAKRFSGIPGQEPPDGAKSFFTDINACFMSENIFHLRSARHRTAAFVYTLAGEQLEQKFGADRHAHIEKALSFMHMNSSLSMTLQELCGYLDLSEAYFVRLFKRKMRIPPMKYFMRMKIHNASLLLMQGMTVKEASERLSFYSESHFSKLFKQYMGVPPKVYKRSYKENPLHRTVDSDETAIAAGAMLLPYMDSIADMVFIKDTSFVYRGCNAAFCRYVGKEREEIFGHTDFTLFPKETADFYRLRDERIFTERKTLNNRELITYPDGARVLVEASKSPYFSPSGVLLGLIGVSRPVQDPPETPEPLTLLLR